MKLSQSLEIRWFFDRPLPPFRKWDETNRPRTDFYAPITDGRSSVKLRGGELWPHLETKHLVRQVGEFQQWSKCSIEIDEADSGNLVDDAQTNWIGVTKYRCLKNFTLDAKQSWAEKDCTSGGGDCIQVEWSRINVREQRFFTFCIEALVLNSKSNSKSYEQSLTMAKSLLSELVARLAIEFPTDCKTTSYPTWLAQQTT